MVKLSHTNGKSFVNLLVKEHKRWKKNKMLEKYWTLLDSPDIAAEECSSHTLILLTSCSTTISTKLVTKAMKHDYLFGQIKGNYLSTQILSITLS